MGNPMFRSLRRASSFTSLLNVVSSSNTLTSRSIFHQSKSNFRSIQTSNFILSIEPLVGIQKFEPRFSQSRDIPRKTQVRDP
ncbi:hypothetical protein LOK49_LG11G00803 [Camellia lanceoleosa]|uniref:Uncharacterized protein n=1 Tax=Camellia lanceoleosa TaxID=1840588 RepID=A0ACC0G2I6_9ERIC|nr:hypothetical protein LOK49_LG11G00803 [Camellia lanceoleosa]